MKTGKRQAAVFEEHFSIGVTSGDAIDIKT